VGLAAAGSLDIALGKWRAPALQGRLTLRLANPTEQTTGETVVRQWRTLLFGGASWRFPLGRLWLQPAAGLGLAVDRVSALPPDAPSTVTRLQLALYSALAAGMTIWPGVALRLELSGNFFPTADRYLAGSRGAVAHSPWADLTILAGMAFDFFR
jgi:hypothetical protein